MLSVGKDGVLFGESAEVPFPRSPAGTRAQQSVSPRWLSLWQGEFKVASGRPVVSEQVSAGRQAGGREGGSHVLLSEGVAVLLSGNL